VNECNLLPAAAAAAASARAAAFAASAQGLTLVLLSAQRKQFLWTTDVHFPAGREHFWWAIFRGRIGKDVSG
jgi:hypothetical protein